MVDQIKAGRRLTEEERRARRARYERARQSQPIRRFKSRKYHAIERGVPFTLTFLQWWRLWDRSGHWHERGNCRGQYVMARHRDRGPYAVGNVRIIRCEQNSAERRSSAEVRARISAGNIAAWVHRRAAQQIGAAHA
jgi:hypothetical protein